MVLVGCHGGRPAKDTDTRGHGFVADFLMPGLVHPLVAMAALFSAAFGPPAALAPMASRSADAARAFSGTAMPQPLRDDTHGPASDPASGDGTGPNPMGDGLDAGPWRQVRIEQRLIIRITPGLGRDMPMPIPEPMFVPRARRGTSCVALGGIAAIAPSSSDSEIVLLLRDRRQVLAKLEKSCNARDFYVGFYAERSSDGLLCTGRDVIHSRAGASCMITRLQEMGH